MALLLWSPLGCASERTATVTVARLGPGRARAQSAKADAHLKREDEAARFERFLSNVEASGDSSRLLRDLAAEPTDTNGGTARVWRLLRMGSRLIRVAALRQTTSLANASLIQARSSLAKISALEMPAAAAAFVEYLYGTLGTVAQPIANLDQVIERFRAAVRLRPGFILARCKLAMALSTNGNNLEAELLGEELSATRADLWEVWGTLAFLAINEGSMAEALQFAQAAVRLEPGSIPLLRMRASLSVGRARRAPSLEAVVAARVALSAMDSALQEPSLAALDRAKWQPVLDRLHRLLREIR